MQRLHAADLVALEIDDGLVVELELAGRQGVAQVVLHEVARLHLRIHLRPEEAIGAAPVGLGAVERQVGVPDQLVGGEAVRGPHGDADAGADHHLLPIDGVGRAHRLDDAQRQRRGIGRLADRHLQHRELVAAHARDGVGFPHQLLQALCHHLQELVAGGMAERVVHGLEVVEVEQVHRHDLAALDAGQRMLEPLVEQHAVGQVGQRVVQRHVHDLGLGAAAFRGVHVGRHEAAVLERHAAHLDHGPIRALALEGVRGARLGQSHAARRPALPHRLCRIRRARR